MFNLRDIQAGYFQMVLIPDVCLDFLISGLCLGGSSVQLIQVQVDLYGVIRLLLGQKNYRLHMARLFNEKHTQPLLYKGMVERTFSFKI